MSNVIQIRAMTGQDIPAGMRLKALAGWNQVEADWQLFLDASPGGCFVALDRQQVIGTVTTLSYAKRLGWIGMLLVDPQHRRQGTGTRLMRCALRHLADSTTIGLDATPVGKPLYEGLGFRSVYELRRMQIAAAPALQERHPSDVMPLSEGIDWALDRRAVGADRHCLLDALRVRTPALAWQHTREGQVRGYCLGRRGTERIQIGPLVAEGAEEALVLCRAALGACTGEPVLLDVPLSQNRFRAMLSKIGFTDRRAFARMVIGADLPGTPECQFAIAGPEYG